MDVQPGGRGGSNDVLDQAYREHWSDVYRYARRLVGTGPPEPEEVAQGAFAKLAGVYRQTPIDNMRAFLFRCANNIVVDYRRRMGVRVQVHDDIFRAAQDEGLSDFSPERVLLGKERLALLEGILANMPLMRRRVFLFVRVEGMPVKDVARKFGLSERAVYQHVSRAMRECDAGFEAAEQEPEARP